MRLDGRTVVHWVMACLMAVWLSGCGGLEKGPAPALPYTPEPPKPKTEKKPGPPALSPSTPIPIQVEPPAVKGGEGDKKEAAPQTPASPDEKADGKQAPADAKSAPEKTGETVKGGDESKNE